MTAEINPPSDSGTSDAAASDDQTDSPPENLASPLGHFLLSTASLPERAVRTTLGLAAGAARETAQLLVPRAFQNSKTYELVVRNSLRFLTEDVGGVKPQEAGQAAENGFMARKAVGN